MSDFSIEVEPPEGEPEEKVPNHVSDNQKMEVVPTKVPEQKGNAPKAEEPKVQEPKVQEPKVQEPTTPNQVSRTFQEMLEIDRPHSIFHHIQSFPSDWSKQHHFRFRHQSDYDQLLQLWKETDPSLTVDLNQSININQCGKDNVDMTLLRDTEPIGKIQFIHFDKKKRDIKSLYYVHVYLYEFKELDEFEKAKTAMQSFFKALSERMSSHRSASHRSASYKKSSTRKSSKKSRKTRKRKLKN